MGKRSFFALLSLLQLLQPFANYIPAMKSPCTPKKSCEWKWAKCKTVGKGVCMFHTTRDRVLSSNRLVLLPLPFSTFLSYHFDSDHLLDTVGPTPRAKCCMVEVSLGWAISPPIYIARSVFFLLSSLLPPSNFFLLLFPPAIPHLQDKTRQDKTRQDKATTRQPQGNHKATTRQDNDATSSST